MELERKLIEAEVLAAPRPAVESWEAAAARLELLAPERWGGARRAAVKIGGTLVASAGNRSPA